MKKGLLLIALICTGSLVSAGQTSRPADPPFAARASKAPEAQSSKSTTTATAKSGARSAIALPPEKAQPVRIPRFETRPVIDGRLDEEVWEHAAIFKDFYQIHPGDNIKPSQPTEVLIGYDSEFLYVGFRAQDDPRKVRAPVCERDNLSGSDYVGIYLDTFNDKRKSYELLFSPVGVQADAIFAEGGEENFSVDIVMESKGMLTDSGYTVEVAVPFRSLRYKVDKSMVWGIHLVRSIKRISDEMDSWMPISRDRSGFLNQEGHISGLDGISTDRMVEIIPTLTMVETGKRVPVLPSTGAPGNSSLADPGRIVNEAVRLNPGLTMKLSITPDVTLSFTAKPDFAEVEADHPVVTAGERFPIFFEEKRPFFLEGIDIFQTSLQAVHTRAIVSPDLAVKLTGKLRRNTFGLLLASDSAPGRFSGDELLDPENFRFIGRNAYIGILRLKRDIGEESSVGLIATSYNLVDKHNQLGGFDGHFRIDPKTVFSFEVLGTTSRRLFFEPNLDQSIYRTGNGFGYSWDYDMEGRRFGYNLSGEGRTRDYRADVGFTRRTNTNAENLYIRYSSEPKPEASLISWRVSNSTGASFDWRGRTQEWENNSQIRLSLRRESFFSVRFGDGYERLFEEEFGPKRGPATKGAFFGDDPSRSTEKRSFYISAGSTPSKKYSLFFSAGYTWGAFDYDFGAGPRFPRVSPAALVDPSAPLDPGPGRSLVINGTFTCQPSNALNLSLDYTRSKLIRNDNGRVAFDDHIYTIRTNYQLNRFTFVRVLAFYDTLSSSISGQFVFGWSPKPGTAIYAVYNDDLTWNGFNPFTGQREPGLHRNGRTFYIKISYLFRRKL